MFIHSHDGVDGWIGMMGGGRNDGYTVGDAYRRVDRYIWVNGYDRVNASKRVDRHDGVVGYDRVDGHAWVDMYNGINGRTVWMGMMKWTSSYLITIEQVHTCLPPPHPLCVPNLYHPHQCP